MEGGKQGGREAWREGELKLSLGTGDTGLANRRGRE